VLALVGIAWWGARVTPLQMVFGIWLPYFALVVFLAGFSAKILGWARSPVPFRIPTTSGQQRSLPWLKADNLDNPHNGWGVWGRMALEILLFRSLFRNTRTELHDGPKLAYATNKWLWLGGLAFHWTFLCIFIRHFKYFAEPVPQLVVTLQNLDGFFQIGLPIIYITDILILAAVSFLFLRRVLDSRLRYISLPADYFPLFLIGGIAVTGILMRYFLKVDVVGVKELATGLIRFHPVVPDGMNPLFFVHLTLVSTLIVYFPFSKLMHMGGVFLSPTRNLANNNRAARHINPWNPTVATHTYEEYEDEFRELMKAADIPVEKE
jgi:nitrate reductase gamma subunit